MELYTEEELRDLLDEAYAMGQQDLVDYIDEAYEDEEYEDYDAYDEDYEDEESAFDQVMQEGLLSNLKEKVLGKDYVNFRKTVKGNKNPKNLGRTIVNKPSLLSRITNKAKPKLYLNGKTPSKYNLDKAINLHKHYEKILNMERKYLKNVPSIANDFSTRELIDKAVNGDLQAKKALDLGDKIDKAKGIIDKSNKKIFNYINNIDTLERNSHDNHRE